MAHQTRLSSYRWPISFELPGTLGLGLTEGPIGIIGGRVGPKGHIEVAGDNKAWVERQVVAVLHKLLSPYGLVHPPSPSW